jgi:glycosyltransferase involved in cell wall biosynthesis
MSISAKDSNQEKMFDEVAVILPAFNEAKRISGLVPELKKFFSRIIVVDDGSKDETAARAREAGALVFSHKHNMGKGAAIRSGFLLVESDERIKALLVMDADGQHSPEDAAELAIFWRKHKGDLVIGARDLRSPDMPRSRIFWNRFISKLFSAAVGRPVRDSQCGLRIYPRKLLTAVLPESKGYVADSEMLAQAVFAGAEVASLPIRTIYVDTPTPWIVKDAWRAFAILFFVSALAAKNGWVTGALFLPWLSPCFGFFFSG